MWPCRSSHRSVCVYCNGRIVHVASTRTRSRSSMTKRCHRRRGCARPTNHLLHQTSLYQQPLHDSRWCLGGLGPYLHEVVSDRRRSHTRDCMCQRGYQVMQHRIPLLLGITVDALSRWRVRVSRHALTCFVPWLAMHPGQGTLPGKPHARHSAVQAHARDTSPTHSKLGPKLRLQRHRNGSRLRWSFRHVARDCGLCTKRWHAALRFLEDFHLDELQHRKGRSDTTIRHPNLAPCRCVPPSVPRN